MHLYPFVLYVVRRQSCKNEVRSQTKMRKKALTFDIYIYILYEYYSSITHEFNFTRRKEHHSSLGLCFYFLSSFRGRVKNERVREKVRVLIKKKKKKEIG